MLRTLLAACFLCMALLALAQERNISGKITDEKDGTPLVGVTVTNTKTGKRAQTDASGFFTIAASTGDVLRFTYVGFNARTFTVGQGNTLNLALASSEEKLDDVVVTAFGIKRQPRSVGYATQTVKGDEVAETQRENFLNSLQGRVAGATVNSTSGAPGASTQIVLRGYNSLSGNNSPLIILDGLPISNNTFSQGQLASDLPNRNNDYQNRAADINPDDIESITVLKGPEATALYGLEAGSGAIVITTKKGKAGKLRINYDNSFRLERNYRFPKVQQVYNNGTNGAPNPGTMSALGPKYAPGTKLYNNVRNFFETGFSQKHNVGFEFGKGGAAGTYRASATWQDQNGVIPHTYFRRFNARFTATNQLFKGFTLINTVGYTHSQNRKAFRGSGGFMLNLILWPQDDDVRNFETINGDRRVVADDGGAISIDNPLWDTRYNRNEDRNDRYIYNVSGSYDVNKWLNVTGRLGVDHYNQFGMYMYARYDVVNPVSGARVFYPGFMEYYSQHYMGLSGNVIATAKHDITKWLKGTLRVGKSFDDFRTETWSERAASTLTSHWFNFKGNTLPSVRENSRTRGRDTLRERRLAGTFGELQLNLKDIFYLSATGRQDITSTLNPNNNRFFYSSFSGSLILSDMIAPKSKWLSFWKLRGSFAETAKDISPYADQSVYTAQTTSGGGFAYGFTNNSPDLRPERQRTFEVGTEIRLFKNRVNADVTYYHTKNLGSIVEGVRLSYGTGFILQTLPIAQTRNEGVELMLSFDVIKKKKFSWTSSFNGARNWNLVTSLPENLPEFYNSDTWLADFRNGLVKGGPTTSITGLDYLRNNRGDILIDPGTGYPLQNPTYQVIGDRNPNFTVGWNNRFTIKSWTISFLLDFRQGGDIVNATEIWMTQRGLSMRTLDREQARIVPGVLRDGLENTANPTRNTIQIVPHYQSDYYSGRTFAVDYLEKGINWAWLRDMTVRYSVPKRVIDRSPIFSSLNFFVTATDLFVITNYSGLNPQANGVTPSTRGVGGFGIDFGTLPNPLGLNFGLVARFRDIKSGR